MGMQFIPTIQTPPDGMMVVAVLPDGLVKPIPQKWTAPPIAPMAGIEAAVADSYGPDARVVTVPRQDFPQHHTVHYQEGQFTFAPVVQPPKPLSLDQLAEVVGYLLPGFEADEPATEPPAPEPEPALEAGADAWKFPAPDDRLSDWETVGDVGPEIPADLAQLMLDDEPLSDAVARMTPSLDELLDMAQVLSDASLERAASALSPESIEDWTERLWVEKARLRTKRGTDDENLSRENLISRVTGTFTRVGAKR